MASFCVSVVDRITPQPISSYVECVIFSFLGPMYNNNVPANVLRCKNQIGGFY